VAASVHRPGEDVDEKVDVREDPPAEPSQSPFRQRAAGALLQEVLLAEEALHDAQVPEDGREHLARCRERGLGPDEAGLQVEHGAGEGLERRPPLARQVGEIDGAEAQAAFPSVPGCPFGRRLGQPGLDLHGSPQSKGSAASWV
jgi:hypothetical protein